MSADRCLCGTPMLPDYLYRRTPKAEREGFRAHRGRGLCSACYLRAVRDGTLLDHERRTVPTPELVREALQLVKQGERSTTAIAERVGVTKDALTKALLRGARIGNPYAVQARRLLPWMVEP